MIALVRPECPKPEALVAKNYKDPVNKEALRQSTFGKCMYCESQIEHVSYAHVEHIKPKAKDKFPELEFSWDNLGFSCQVCNTNKGEKYDNMVPFINPYNENPKDHLVFLGWFIFSRHGSERGELTIQELDLNRSKLIDRRKDRIEKLDIMIKAAFRTTNEFLRNQLVEEIKKEAENDKEYSAAVERVLITQKILES